MRRDRERTAPPKARPSSAMAERLRATEEALAAARDTIARQERREVELRRRLEADGVAAAAQQDDPLLDAKVAALKKMQDQKVRALMRSIGQLQAQIETLKAQDQEHRRSALIQNLRKQQREQELLIDVLKQTLLEKVPEFQNSRAVVNDFVTRKAVGGPLRFRPKTREELENELWQVEQKFRSAMDQIRQERKRGNMDRGVVGKAVLNEEEDDSKDEETAEDDTDLKEATGPEVSEGQSALEQQLANYQADIVAKTATIHSQADEINELYVELDRFRVFEEKSTRKKHKIAQLREQIATLENESIARVREREEISERFNRLQEELQFLRDNKADDLSAKDEERLEALEQIHILRSREIELQKQIEEQQKRWAIERTNMNQQLRLVEKEKQLLEDEKRIAINERTSASKKYAIALQDAESAQKALEDERNRSESLAERIKLLEDMNAKYQTQSSKKIEATNASTAERIHQLSIELEQKTEQLKNTERQLSAAKLLIRQSKKEKEQLEERLGRALQQEVRPASQSNA